MISAPPPRPFRHLRLAVSRFVSGDLAARRAHVRETPAEPLAERLFQLGAEVRFHDPHVKTWRIGSTTLHCKPHLEEALETADVTIVVTQHRGDDPAILTGRARLLLDTRGRMRSHAADTIEVL